MTAETLYPGLDAISGVPLVASSCLARTAKTCKLLIEQRVRFGRRQGSHTLREESAMSWTCRTNCATSTARCFVVGYARTTLLLLPTFSDPLNS